LALKNYTVKYFFGEWSGKAFVEYSGTQITMTCKKVRQALYSDGQERIDKALKGMSDLQYVAGTKQALGSMKGMLFGNFLSQFL
jgi:hypothetical protein